jgi:hypothetical protein
MAYLAEGVIFPSRWWLEHGYEQGPLLPLVRSPPTGISPQGWTEWPRRLTEWAVPFLVTIVTTQQAASAMKNKEAAQQVIATGETAISQFLDDYCGTPPRLIPWPFPGPPPWISEIASQLAKEAHTIQAGSLQTAMLQLSGRVLDALNPQPLPPNR